MKREDPNKQNKKWKRRNYNSYHRNLKKIIKEYYKQLYANTLDNWEEMGKFLETYNLPRLNQEETDYLNRLINSSEIESVIQKLPAKESPGTNGFTREFYQIYKDIIPITFKLLQTIEGNTPKFILWGHHYPDTKTRQTTKKGKLWANISDEYRCKNPKQNISKPNSTIQKKDHIPWSSGIYSWMQEWFKIHKSVNVVHHTKK